MVATAFTVMAFSLFPAQGVKSDVIVIFSKQPDGLYARDITFNALLIAESSLRERKVRNKQLQASYENLASSSHGGNTFSVSTYGQDEAQNLARENRTALNEILLDLRKHYGTTFPVFFDVIGNTYETIRWSFVVAISLVSLLLSAYIVSNLFSVLFVKTKEDQLDDERSQDFQEWYKDKQVLEQISVYEKTPPKNPTSHKAAQSEAKQSFEQQKHAAESKNTPVDQKVWVPQPQSEPIVVGVQEQQEESSAQVDAPQEREGNMQQAKVMQTTQRSRLAEKWGKGSAADRLRALETSQGDEKKERKESQNTTGTFSLSSLPRSKKNESNVLIVDAEKEMAAKEDSQSKSKSKKIFSLPHQRFEQEAAKQELDDTMIERAQDCGEVRASNQSEQTGTTQKSDEIAENFFVPGGSLSQNPTSPTIQSSGGRSGSAIAPGNLPVVDVSQFSTQPDTQTHQQMSSSPEATYKNMEQVHEVHEQIDFTSEDSQILVDSKDESQDVDPNSDEQSLQVVAGEPSSEDLKKRLNKLLRGEL